MGLTPSDIRLLVSGSSTPSLGMGRVLKLYCLRSKSVFFPPDDDSAISGTC